MVDHIAVINNQPKRVGSSEGHLLAATSPFQSARISGAKQRLEICRKAIIDRDFSALAEISELDSNMMHAVIMTSRKRIFYWEAGSLSVMQAVIAWRKNNIPAFYTLDAGPNVHVICPSEVSEQVYQRLSMLSSVKQIITAKVGGSARLI